MPSAPGSSSQRRLRSAHVRRCISPRAHHKKRVWVGTARTDVHKFRVSLHQAGAVFERVGHIGALLRQHLVAVQNLLAHSQILCPSTTIVR
eukprot:2920385-Rhodomonas_salina.3